MYYLADSYVELKMDFEMALPYNAATLHSNDIKNVFCSETNSVLQIFE